MTLMQQMSLLWIRFTPLEKRLLAEIRSVLPEAAKPLYDAQIAAITKVQRLLNWNEISFYCIRRWNVDWKGVPMFPCTDEMQLAEVRFKVGNKHFKAKLFSIAGHIFDFHIHPGGRSIAFLSWNEDPEVTLLDDPMRQPTGSKKPEDLLPVWSEFLEKHQNNIFEGWILYNATSAYCISLEEGEFLLLAERDGEEFVLQRLEPFSDKLFYMEGHDGIPKLLSRDLESIIRICG